MKRRIHLSSVLSFLFLSGCGDGGSTTAPTTTTTTAPRIVTSEFILSRPNCFFGWSRPLKRLAVGETFTVRFKPLVVNEERNSDWANTVDFWLDRIEGDQRDAIALVFSWSPDSRWFIDSFTPQGGFRFTGRRELINVNGDFREVTFVRAAGVSEWLLDRVVVLQLPDTKPERTVYTRVVGTDALFQFEEVVSSALASESFSTEPNACVVAGPALCLQITDR